MQHTNMGLGSKMKHGVNLLLLKYVTHKVRLANIALCIGNNIFLQTVSK